MHKMETIWVRLGGIDTAEFKSIVEWLAEVQDRPEHLVARITFLAEAMDHMPEWPWHCIQAAELSDRERTTHTYAVRGNDDFLLSEGLITRVVNENDAFLRGEAA